MTWKEPCNTFLSSNSFVNSHFFHCSVLRRRENSATLPNSAFLKINLTKVTYDVLLNCAPRIMISSFSVAIIVIFSFISKDHASDFEAIYLQSLKLDTVALWEETWQIVIITKVRTTTNASQITYTINPTAAFLVFCCLRVIGHAYFQRRLHFGEFLKQC